MYRDFCFRRTRAKGSKVWRKQKTKELLQASGFDLQEWSRPGICNPMVRKFGENKKPGLPQASGFDLQE